MYTLPLPSLISPAMSTGSPILPAGIPLMKTEPLPPAM
jgi:hypothetical protein